MQTNAQIQFAPAPPLPPITFGKMRISTQFPGRRVRFEGDRWWDYSEHAEHQSMGRASYVPISPLISVLWWLSVKVHFANQETKQFYGGVTYEAAAKCRTDKSLGVQCKLFHRFYIIWLRLSLVGTWWNHWSRCPGWFCSLRWETRHSVQSTWSLCNST